jgi:hypothetical protein
LSCHIKGRSHDRFRCLLRAVWNGCESHEPSSEAALHHFWRRRRRLVRSNAPSRRRFAAQAFASRPRAAATYARAPRGLRHKKRWQRYTMPISASPTSAVTTARASSANLTPACTCRRAVQWPGAEAPRSARAGRRHAAFYILNIKSGKRRAARPLALIATPQVRQEC